MSRENLCHQIARDPDFSALLRKKAILILPATGFFIVYYFALPIAAGWFPELMQREIWGRVNVAYLFALSQFLMTWGLAFLYVWAAAGWDRQEHRLLKKFGEDNRK
ncbi:MAG: DUF485 domain-containing protein [Candidatus Methylacidiphilales bacterium]|jgi:uncharacterized membrane protein (DUF485 family)